MNLLKNWMTRSQAFWMRQGQNFRMKTINRSSRSHIISTFDESCKFQLSINDIFFIVIAWSVLKLYSLLSSADRGEIPMERVDAVKVAGRVSEPRTRSEWSARFSNQLKDLQAFRSRSIAIWMSDTTIGKNWSVRQFDMQTPDEANQRDVMAKKIGDLLRDRRHTACPGDGDKGQINKCINR